MSFSQGAPTLPLIGAASNVLLTGSSTTGNAFTVQQLSTGNVFSFVTSTGIPALGASGSGNIGIGTTNPTDQINLASGSIVVTNSAATANGILFNQNSVYGGIDVEGIANTGAQTLNLGINNNRAKPWNSSYLGAWFRVDTRTGFNYKGFHWFRRDATTGTETEIMTLTSDGNLGVGRLYPQTKISADTSSTTTGLGIYNADVAMMFGNTGGASNFASIQVRAGGSSTGIGTGTYVLALNPEGGSVAIGANTGTSIPSQFYVQASAVTTVRAVPSGTVVTFDKSDGPLLTFRQSQNNGTYSGLVWQDNNIGAWLLYRNYTGASSQYGDYLHIGGYNGVYIYGGTPDAVNPASATCLISACYNQNGSSGAVNTVNVGIGITNPSNYTLHVNGSQYTNETIYFPANGAGLSWAGGASQIYDNGNLYINTDDYMYIQAPTTLTVTSPATTFSGTVTGTGLNTLINLYGASARALNIGQTAYYDPASQVSGIALNINCGDNQYYEVMILNKGPYTNTNLDLNWLPNNTTYSGQFQCAGLLSGTSGTIGSAYYGSISNFYFDDIGGGVAPPYLHKLYVYTGNSNAYGMIMNVSAGGSGGTNCGENFTSSVWNSTSTRWTSLGTVNSNTTSYLILVTRLY
jgi:hypothetical protein